MPAFSSREPDVIPVASNTQSTFTLDVKNSLRCLVSTTLYISDFLQTVAQTYVRNVKKTKPEIICYEVSGTTSSIHYIKYCFC